MPTATELIAAYKAGGNKDLSTAQITGAVPLPTTSAPATIAPVAAVNTQPTKIATPVVSSAPASTSVTGVIKPAIDSANAALAEQQRQRSIALAQGQIKSQADMDAFTKQQQTSATKEQPLSPADQAAADVANTPDQGFKWAYQKDGTRTQIPLSASASQYGFSDTKPIAKVGFAPTGATPTETIPLDNGTSLAKLSDGTYGSFDAQGNYVGSVNETSYNNSKLTSNAYQLQQDESKRAELNTKIDQIINGTYPLSSDQQAQIDSIKKTYADLIAAQGKANTSYVGGVQVSSARSGGMEYSPTVAMGEVKNAIDQGEAKIASLNNELLGTVAKMNSAFRSDNMKMLNDAYKNYSDQIDKRQAEIDKIREASAKALNDARNYQLDVEKFQEKSYYDDLSAKLASDTLSLNEKKMLLDDKQFMAKLSEDKRHNLATELDNQQKNALKAAELSGANTSFSGDTPFAGMITRLSNLIPKNSRGEVVSNLADAANSKNWKLLLGQAQDQVEKNGVMGADATRILKAKTDLGQLNRMEQAIKAYKDKGGDMNLLSGTYAQIKTNLGLRYKDGELQTLATDLNNAFYDYRQNMTGAAFGAKESQQYGSVVPSTTDTYELALDKIKGAKNFTKGYLDSAYGSKIEGYKNLSDLADIQDKKELMTGGATDPTQALQNIVAKGGKDQIVHIQNTAKAQGINLTDAEILELYDPNK